MKKSLFQVDDHVLPNVLKFFNRTEKSAEEDVVSLKKWMESQPHLPETMTAKMILNFLIQNKFSMERSKKKIDMYYTIKSKLPDIYGKINPGLEEMKRIRNTLYAVIHPQLTKEMYRVLFLKVRNKDMIDLLQPGDVPRLIVNLQELRMREDVAFGDVMIIDCDGFKPYIFKLTPTAMYKSMVLIYERVYSLRMRHIYVINFPKFAEALLGIVKSLLNPKIFNRIHICSSVDELKTFFPDAMLPTDFGGKGHSLEELKEMWDSNFEENKDLFDHLDQVRVNEMLRPQKLKDDDILGYYGSFRKVDLD